MVRGSMHGGSTTMIGDAHLTENGGGAQGPSEPECLAGRTIGTWLPYMTSL
jgi:hypothetical protein